ncbi:MAG: dodecin family protein, partial [Gemmatimonadota bacterium]|nr:dodecin family protein [Gemmatimonadota bacterium]
MAHHDVAKIIEIVGSSKEGWAQAADAAVRTASKSVKNITGVQV